MLLTIGYMFYLSKKAERKIDEAENQGANKNDTIQDQIDREQKRIDTAYTRIQTHACRTSWMCHLFVLPTLR